MTTMRERAAVAGMRCHEEHVRRRIDVPWACQECVEKALRAERESCAQLIESLHQQNESSQIVGTYLATKIREQP